MFLLSSPSLPLPPSPSFPLPPSPLSPLLSPTFPSTFLHRHSDGQKMSKRLKNYPDPVEVVKKHGADALRLYLVNSPVVRAESLRFKEKGVKDVVKDVFLPWFNAYRFLIQNVQRLQEVCEGVRDVWVGPSKLSISICLLNFTLSCQSCLLPCVIGLHTYHVHACRRRVCPSVVRSTLSLATSWIDGSSHAISGHVCEGGDGK